MSTAIVSNITLAGSASRLAQARSIARQMVEGAQGPSATLGRDQAGSASSINAAGIGAGRRGEFQDYVANFGGVLVSQEVGATLMRAQALSASYRLPPAEAERQLSNYEFIQSLAGPAEIVLPSAAVR